MEATPSPLSRKLLFPAIDNLQHFRFLATVVSPVHIECLGIVVDDLPNGTIRHFPSARLRVRSFQRDSLAVGAGRAFHDERGGAHGIEPDRYILL